MSVEQWQDRIPLNYVGGGAKLLDCDIVGSEIETQSGYYDQFQTNTLEKIMIPLYP